MNKADLLDKLRLVLCDAQKIGFPEDSELFDYLDRATSFYSEQMIAVRDPSMMKNIPVMGTMLLPDDFVRMAGQHPVAIVGKSMEYYGAVPHEILYFARLPLPSTFGDDDELPYTVDQVVMIVNMASVYAQNRNEYDITQDTALISAWAEAMKGARS